MSATTFTQFSSLCKELRDMIWSAAAAIQFQHIADNLPTSSSNPCAERRRQAFVGYDNLPSETERQPLRVYVRESYNGHKMRLDINEFQALVNSIPIATASYEARSYVVNLCRDRIKIVDLYHSLNAQGNDEHGDTGVELLENVFVQPTTLVVTKWRANSYNTAVNFESQEHLIDVVTRVFGSCVEKVVLNLWADSQDDLEKIYWPHTAQIQRDEWEETDRTFIRDPSHDLSTVFMTPDRKLHVSEKLWVGNEYDMEDMARYLLKLFEILDVAKERLPGLQSIDMKLHTYCWDDILSTRIRAVHKDGVLWVDWSDVAIGFHHRFVEVVYSTTPELSD
ncbi:hypothetical protein K504DRAFT_486258 [Pleomassaria siparia CBS 279.74]|uniref:Uncharacterized protein n=1 Tax=Pleomassaria siparia CBS 279.74 TaxID=1314801 RepID=A0A6G1KPJ7_9PLEO|nr:hypothetical protein K504DRAFT_486258 [Pleomassaria siparia CBS 279.74]